MVSHHEDCTVSRRTLIAGGAAAAFIAKSAVSFAASLTSRDLVPKSRNVVDVHHHVLPPAYLKANAAKLGGRITGYSHILLWTPEKSLAEMDSAGVATSVLSMSAPVWFGDVAQARELARATNEYMRDLMLAHPGRFASFACLPMPDVEGSILEARDAVAKGALGIGLMSNYQDVYLGDPKFAPLFAELERLGKPVYIHPTTASCCGVPLVSDVAPAMLELPFDSTRCIASLLYAGTFSRHRKLPFIFSHGGGTIPFVADRLSAWAKVRPDLSARLPDGPMAELKRLYFDTSSVSNSYAMASLLPFASAERLLFGTDYPFIGIAPQLAELDALNLDPASLSGIRHGNAQRLLAMRG